MVVWWCGRAEISPAFVTPDVTSKPKSGVDPFLKPGITRGFCGLTWETRAHAPKKFRNVFDFYWRPIRRIATMGAPEPVVVTRAATPEVRDVVRENRVPPEALVTDLAASVV